VAAAYSVDPVHGGARFIGGLWPFALSRDGNYVIGETPVTASGGFAGKTNILRAPWGGGKTQVLLRRAMNPSFSG
jgi:hypothetical protein